MNKIQSLKRVTVQTGASRIRNLRVAVAFALGAACIMPAFADDAVTTGEIQGLKSQVDQLQKQLEILQSKQQSAAKIVVAQNTPAATTAPATPATSTSTTLHAGMVNLTFGGFTELAMIYRDHNEVADVGSNFNGS